ncbi:MAG: hypothetical protein ACOC05_00595 [Oceanicaulis sp.]
MAGLVLSSAAVSPAFSLTVQDDQPVDDWLSAFEISQEADADLLIAAGGADAPYDPPYADVRYRVEAETVRADGLRWGLRVGAGAVRHDGGRGAGGAVGCSSPCPAQGLATGLYAAPGYGPAKARAGLEQAELFIRHPYVQLRAGITATAAGLERPARMRAFRLAGADGPLADPTGRTLSDTGLSLTSPAPGVSAQTRRIVGLRGAVSYTPEADACGLDHCRPGAAAGLAPGVGEIWSAALSFDRRSPGDAVRWAAYAGGERGALDGAGPAGFDDPWTAGFAVVREAGGASISARWLVSNDGLSHGRYKAAAVSAAYEAGDWLYSAEAGYGRSEAFATASSTLVFGASRLVGRNGLAGLGVQIAHHDPAGGPRADEAALLLETGLRF